MLENLLRTLLRSVRLHDPLGVHPTLSRRHHVIVSGIDLKRPRMPGKGDPRGDGQRGTA